MRFRNGTDAGRQLAERLRNVDIAEPVVLALPRGGVPSDEEVLELLERARAQSRSRR
ncbi:MAG TPA: hypothetical protein VGV93_08370 [Acidimicrobiales bacterium]|nr:hypothetical protein [Acidimicrobiales bacterium]